MSTFPPHLGTVVRWLVSPLVPAGPRDSDGAVDVIVVLGAPVTRDGALGTSLRERVEAGAAAWHARRAPWLLVTGGRTRDAAVTEAEAMRRHALARGVPDQAILVEDRARSTVENARFAAALMRERGLERALLVTQPYHLRRSLALFTRAGVAARPLVLDESWIYRGGWTSLRALRWVAREYVILAGTSVRR
jgi:uncharacterized SAM-binding protein YcdF (DUF218 family)